MNALRRWLGLAGASLFAACAAPAFVPHVPAPPPMAAPVPPAGQGSLATQEPQQAWPATPPAPAQSGTTRWDQPIVLRTSLSAARPAAPEAFDRESDEAAAHRAPAARDEAAAGTLAVAPAPGAAVVDRRGGWRGPVVVPLWWGVPDPLGYGLARAARRASPRLVRDVLLGPWSWLHRAWR
ncbi:MAG: hypothetical protein JNK49_19900 [Planctomycetes bacterium]|nr:hypothetical protein [Planctomycetota bacterium]